MKLYKYFKWCNTSWLKPFFIVSIFSSIFLISIITFSDQKGDNIIGYYHSIDPFTKEESQNYIYKTSDNTYEGSVSWVKNPKKKKFLGYVFLKKLTYNSKNKRWENGILTYPGKKGKFKTYMVFSSSKTLKVRGYWGFSFLGMTVSWKKDSGLRTSK